MNNRETVNVYLYSGVNVDPTYQQLHRVNLSADEVHQTGAMQGASIAKLTYPLRFEKTDADQGGYIEAFNSNYLQIEFLNAGFSLYAFITNVQYVNAGVLLIDYEIDYFNTYYQDFLKSTAFIKQTSLKLDNIQGKIDTPTLDHTSPQTLLTTQTQPVDHTTVEVYYYDSTVKNGGTAYQASAPQVKESHQVSKYSETSSPVTGGNGSTYQATSINRPGLSYNLSHTDFNNGNVNAADLTPQNGLCHLTFDNIADIIASPALYNSDGSSKILYAELHEHYQNETITFDVTPALQSKQLLNTENPFVQYVLSIGGSTQEIPSRYLQGGKLTVKHQYSNDPGSPDLFMIGSDSLTNRTMNIGKLKTPLVLNGVWAKFYKQRHRLNASAQKLINNLNTTIKNFVLDNQISETSANIGKNASDNSADIAKAFANERANNDNNKSKQIIANNYNNSKQNTTASQQAAAQQIANTLATSIENTNKLNQTALDNLKLTQGTQLSNQSSLLGVSRTNLIRNQSAQSENLSNNRDTSYAAITINALSNFFKTGAGAALSGSMKGLIMGLVSGMINNAIDTETAYDKNTLQYDGMDDKIPPQYQTGSGSNGVNDKASSDKSTDHSEASDENVNITTKTGAKARLDRVQNAQRSTLDASNGVAINNLNNTQATAQATMSNSNKTRSDINQNNANTAYSNQQIGFNKDWKTLDYNNANQQANQQTSYTNGLTQLSVSNSETKAENLNTLTQALQKIWKLFAPQTDKLFNTIDNEIKNFNIEIQALLDDAQYDKVMVGSQDDRGQISNGLRNVILTAYYQGETITKENRQLVQRYGLSVNKSYKISDILSEETLEGRLLVTDGFVDSTGNYNIKPFMYLQADNLTGMNNCPIQARQTLAAALASGVQIYYD